MNKKVQISQDTLYKYLTEHGVTVSRLAELMNTTAANINSCFLHHKNSDGSIRRFTSRNIPELNQALEKMAEDIRSRVLTFGSDQTFTNQRGNTYDPALVERMKNDVGYYFNLTALCEKVLGWKKSKKHNVLETISSKVYGYISQDDVNRINAELLSVAGVLSSYEVVPDEGSSLSDSSNDRQTVDRQPQAPVNADEYHERLDQFIRAISDTSLPLTERYRIYHERYPDGIIFFRVNDGYTVAQDDARRLVEYDSNIYPYTDMDSGLTTAFMSADIYKKIEEKCIIKGWQTTVVEMY